MFKLIATDIDGTFFDDDHDYDHERFNRQLKLLHEQGVKFAIASGNYLGHLQRVVQFSPVDAFVSENGAHIMAGDDEVFASYLKSDTVNAIIDGLDSLGDNLQSFILSGEEATYVDSKFEPFLNKYYIHNYQLTDDVFKVNISLNDDKLDEVTADLNSRFADEIHATASGFGSIDIISKGINKAFGLQKLADFYGIGLDEIVSFGDNSNDDEMLAETGLGFAMKNAKASTQKAADHVTEFDNNYQGVLETIDSIFGFNTK